MMIKNSVDCETLSSHYSQNGKSCTVENKRARDTFQKHMEVASFKIPDHENEDRHVWKLDLVQQ